MDTVYYDVWCLVQIGTRTGVEQTGMFSTQGMMCQHERNQEVRYQGMGYQNQEPVVLGAQELWCSVPRKMEQ